MLWKSSSFSITNYKHLSYNKVQYTNNDLAISVYRWLVYHLLLLYELMFTLLVLTVYKCHKPLSNVFPPNYSLMLVNFYFDPYWLTIKYVNIPLPLKCEIYKAIHFFLLKHWTKYKILLQGKPLYVSKENTLLNCFTNIGYLYLYFTGCVQRKIVSFYKNKGKTLSTLITLSIPTETQFWFSLNILENNYRKNIIITPNAVCQNKFHVMSVSSVSYVE